MFFLMSPKQYTGSIVLEYGPLNPGQRCVVIPATFEPNAEMPFTLVIFSSNEILCEELEGRDPVSVAGEWKKGTAGGCVNHDSWKKNPAFKITSAKGLFRYFFLCRMLLKAKNFFSK